MDDGITDQIVALAREIMEPKISFAFIVDANALIVRLSSAVVADDLGAVVTLVQVSVRQRQKSAFSTLLHFI